MSGEDKAPLVLIDVDGVLSPEFTCRRSPNSQRHLVRLIRPEERVIACLSPGTDQLSSPWRRRQAPKRRRLLPEPEISVTA